MGKTIKIKLDKPKVRRKITKMNPTTKVHPDKKKQESKKKCRKKIKKEDE